MILNEGGNVFKTEPDKTLIAQRIATPDVDPTIKWLEKVVGFEIDEQDLLGTTGKRTHPSGKFLKNSSRLSNEVSPSANKPAITSLGV